MSDADRVTYWEAKKHFEAGGKVVVSEYGALSRLPVGKLTVYHTKETIAWEELHAQVRMWRNRYPNQRYYIIKGEVQ